jgi:hypothetical protein
MWQPPAPDAAQIRADPDHWTPDPPGTDVEVLLHRRAPVRLRVAQTVALLVASAVVVSLVVRSLPVASGPSLASVATPAPVPLGPVLVLSNVSTGSVIVNGRRLAGSPPLVASFRPGRNTLTLAAPPFRPLTCHVQWPGRQNDGGCAFPTDIALPVDVAGQLVWPMLVVVLPLRSVDLPGASQAQALTAATAALQRVPPSMRVAQGEYIATGQDRRGDIISQSTSTPLRADLLSATTTFNYVGDILCDAPGCLPLSAITRGQHTARLSWVVAPQVAVRWQFSSGAGVVARSAPLPTLLPMPLLLRYDAQAGWIVDEATLTQLQGYELPAALAQTVCSTIDDVPSVAALQQQGFALARPPDLPPSRGLEGCELQLQTPQGAPAGRFVWRFGVLLAADAQTRLLLPGIPLAPASELAAVGA